MSTFNSPSNNIFLNQPIVAVIAGAYAVSQFDRFIEVNFAGPVTITLPVTSTSGITDNTGQAYSIKDISGNASTNNITIVVAGGAQIDGASSYVISDDYGSIDVFSDGVKFWVSAQANTASAVSATYNTNSGVATPAAGVLNVFGVLTQGITTSAVGSTVTITGTNATIAQIGVSALSSNALAIAGADGTTSVTPSALAAKLGTQTAHGVALGEGVATALAYTAVGSTGFVLTGTTGADPAFAAIGTNSSLTAHGVLLGEGLSPFAATVALGNGALVIGSVGVDPVVANLTAGPGVSIVNGPGSITISSSGIAWTTTIPAMAVAGKGYIVNVGSPTIALPTTSAVGDTFQIVLAGGTSWSISQAALQSIQVGNTISTVGVGGSLSSTMNGDGVLLVCSVANLSWISPIAPEGNLNIV